MNWTYRVARVAGIDVKIHITFFLIVILGAIQWGMGNGALGTFFGAGLILLLFLCVTLHELGHSIVAQRFGIPVRQIILLPLGGVALIEKQPEKPLHELLIAIAGPLVNVVIAILLIAVTDVANITILNEQGMVPGAELNPSLSTLFLWLIEANITLVVFNMIPAFPLDGGRVLRAVLAMFFGFRRATRIAGTIGQVLAVVLGVLGVVSGNIILVLVAVFIFFGAGQEQQDTQARTVLHTRCVGDAYNKHVHTLSVGDRVSKVIDYILTSYQPDFAVIQDNKLIGIVTREDMLRAMATKDSEIYIPDAYVTVIMQRDIVKVDASASLDEVRQVMQEQSTRIVAVYSGDTYLGLVSKNDIQEAFVVLTFAERNQKHATG